MHRNFSSSKFFFFSIIFQRRILYILELCMHLIIFYVSYNQYFRFTIREQGLFCIYIKKNGVKILEHMGSNDTFTRLEGVGLKTHRESWKCEEIAEEILFRSEIHLRVGVADAIPCTFCAARSLSRGSVERVAAAIRRYFLATGFAATAWSVFFVADIASSALTIQGISGTRILDRILTADSQNDWPHLGWERSSVTFGMRPIGFASKRSERAMVCVARIPGARSAKSHVLVLSARGHRLRRRNARSVQGGIGDIFNWVLRNFQGFRFTIKKKYRILAVSIYMLIMSLLLINLCPFTFTSFSIHYVGMSQLGVRDAFSCDRSREKKIRERIKETKVVYSALAGHKQPMDL